MNEFEQWWADPREICPTSETFAESAFLAGQAAERKRCAEIAKKDIGEQCTCVVCRERRKIAKAIEGE